MRPASSFRPFPAQKRFVHKIVTKKCQNGVDKRLQKGYNLFARKLQTDCNAFSWIPLFTDTGFAPPIVVWQVHDLKSVSPPFLTEMSEKKRLLLSGKAFFSYLRHSEEKHLDNIASFIPQRRQKFGVPPVCLSAQNMIDYCKYSVSHPHGACTQKHER